MKCRVLSRCAVVLLVAILCLAGCAQKDPPSDAEPARVQPIAGTELHRVIITEQASQVLGIRTLPVREATSAVSAVSAGSTGPGTATGTVIPMTAVIYDPRGRPWVYTTPSAMTFVRVPIVIDGMIGDTAHLTSGPPVGTPVVTVGASELLGAEYGVGGE
jgi:hypothetical protein